MPTTKFRIRNIATGAVLAEDLLDTQVTEWWQQHDDEYFGVRVEGPEILVAPHGATIADNTEGH